MRSSGSGALPSKCIALIHVAAKQLRLDEDTYRAILKVHGGVESAKALNQRGFEAVMAYFTAHGFRSDWTQRTYGKRPGRASPAQIDMIRSLWREWSNDPDDAALNHWLERSYRVSTLRFLTPDIAAKAINGLRAMTRRKHGQKSEA